MRCRVQQRHQRMDHGHRRSMGQPLPTAQAFKNVLDGFHKHRAITNQLMTALGGGVVDGNPESRTPRALAPPPGAAVISEPLAILASTTSTPNDSPLIIRLRLGKLPAWGAASSGNSETTALPWAIIAAASLRWRCG